MEYKLKVIGGVHDGREIAVQEGRHHVTLPHPIDLDVAEDLDSAETLPEYRYLVHRIWLDGDEVGFLHPPEISPREALAMLLAKYRP